MRDMEGYKIVSDLLGADIIVFEGQVGPILHSTVQNLRRTATYTFFFVTTFSP